MDNSWPENKICQVFWLFSTVPVSKESNKYRKLSKFSDTRKIAVIIHKSEHCGSSTE